jgi:hypothetical protein
LRLWHLAQITESAGNQASTVFREAPELLHCAANLLSLRRGKTLHRFGAINDAAPAIRRHVIQLCQAIQHTLLGLRRKLAKARLVFQGALLFWKRKVAVAIHPLREMLLVSPRPRTWNWSSLRDWRS